MSAGEHDRTYAQLGSPFSWRELIDELQGPTEGKRVGVVPSGRYFTGNTVARVTVRMAKLD